MIFKPIEDEASKTAVTVTKIFSELRSERKALFAEASTESDFRFTDSLKQYKEMKYAIDIDKQAIKSFIQSVQDGASREEALAESFRDASSGAKEYASSLSALEIHTKDATSAAVEFEAQQKTRTSCEVRPKRR